MSRDRRPPQHRPKREPHMMSTIFCGTENHRTRAVLPSSRGRLRTEPVAKLPARSTGLSGTRARDGISGGQAPSDVLWPPGLRNDDSTRPSRTPEACGGMDGTEQITCRPARTDVECEPVVQRASLQYATGYAFLCGT